MKNKSKLIYQSRNYSEFFKDESNRQVRTNPKLKASIEKYGWLDAFPMLVVLKNGRKVIKDGQHRYDIAQEASIPLKYVICEEDGIQASEISVGLSWSLQDFISSFAQRGNEHYARLQSFKNETGIPLGTCASLLYGNSGACCISAIVKDGAFKIRNEGHARSVVAVIHAAAQVVNLIEQLYNYRNNKPIAIGHEIKQAIKSVRQQNLTGRKAA